MTLNNYSPKKTCTYCLKKYTNKTSLDKHILICCLLYKSKRQIKIEEEESQDIPTYKELCIIISELYTKVKKLEEKGELYDKYMNKMKKKINIIDWLNSNIKPNSYLDDFINNLIILEDEIIFMMNNTFMDTLYKILDENINQRNNHHNQIPIPIFCSNHKINLFYIYSKETSETSDPKWTELNKNQCIQIFNIIYAKIFKKLMEWKQKNEDQLIKSEQLDNLFMKTMVKILAVDFKHEQTLSKAKTSLYNIVKTDMKQIVEYEFI
jgi:hypothetical protein